MIPYYDFINLLKDNIFCWKMLVFDLNAFHSMINISVYIELRNKIKDSLRICMARAVEERIKLLLKLPRKPRNHQKQSVNSFLRECPNYQISCPVPLSTIVFHVS